MSKKTILYVEDDLFNQKIIRLFLKNEPCDVITCENQEDALKILKSHNIALIIMDLNLQEEGDGITLIQSIRSFPDYLMVPVFVFSGYDEQHLKKHGIQNQIQRFFQKPTDKNTLVGAIRDTLEI